MIIDKEELDLIQAEQQFVGFSEGVVTGNIISLIEAMGLTRKEWKELRNREMVNSLRKKDIKTIDKYFKIKK